MNLEDQLTEIFYRHDPVGLAEVGAPEDEYLPKAKEILPPLKEATSQEQLRSIIHSVFLRVFGAEETSGPESAYEALAQEIWTRFLANKETGLP